MRITTANAFDTGVDNLQRRQQELQLAQDQLTSGKRVARASDDPAAAARAERALATSARTEADQRGLEASRNVMTQTEGALGDAGEACSRCASCWSRPATPATAMPSAPTSARRIRGLREQLFAVANRGDGAGGYLFGGQGAAQPPFVDGAGGVRLPRRRRPDRGAGRRPAADDDRRRRRLARRAQRQRRVRHQRRRPATAAAPGSTAAGWPTRRALTGADYTLQFSVAAGVTTYAVLKDGAPPRR